MHSRIISFSLYGTAPRYLQGMVENARLAPEIYPGWSVRVYCENETPTDELEKLGCQIHRMGRNLGHSGMFWRLRPAWDIGISRVIFRDADSRLNVREAAAVREWMDSGLAAHAMHDHPHHENTPLMGGAWGIMGGALPAHILNRLAEAYASHVDYGQDQKMLGALVFPLIRESLLVHSCVPVRCNLSTAPKPFPDHEPWEGFVGQQIGDDGKPLWAGLPPAVRSGGEVAA